MTERVSPIMGQLLNEMFEGNEVMAGLAADQIPSTAGIMGVDRGPQSVNAEDYVFTGRVEVVTEESSLLGNPGEQLSRAMEMGGAAPMGVHGSQRINLSLDDLEGRSDQELSGLVFNPENRFPSGLQYVREDGVTVTLPASATLTGQDMQRLWNDPVHGQSNRSALARHFESGEEQNVVVRRLGGEEVAEIEFLDVSGSFELRESAMAIDPDQRGNGQQQPGGGDDSEGEEPGAETRVAGVVAEGAESPNERDQMQGLLDALGGAGTGFSATFLERNRVGLGGNWDIPGAWTSIGAVAGGATALYSLMPSTTLMPGVHVNSGALAGATYMVEGIGGVLGAPGLAFRARSVRENMLDIQRTEAVIGTIKNSAIPIEYLIMVVLAHVYDSADKRMRLKLEEIMIAEQMERRREMRQGIVDMFEPIPFLGAGARVLGS
ncbi:MAG: hypothetical protein AAFX94_06640, partial [Myxococcota bacterium]